MSSNGINIVAMRIRAFFSKTEPMRFTSHLDLYRAWERLLRRADVPLVFSQGYNPRPRIQLASPLPLGITSRSEIIDFWVEMEIEELESFKAKLVHAQPPGIEIERIEAIDPASPPLQNNVSALEYSAQVLTPIPNINNKIESLMSSESIIRQRHGKTYDLRPLIQHLSLEQGDTNSHPMIFLRLDAREGKTGRPEEVMLALDISPEHTRIERKNILFQS